MAVLGWAGAPAVAGRAATSPPRALATFSSHAIAAGESHSMVVGDDGTLWTFGGNDRGQLGVPANVGTTTPNPTPTPIMTGIDGAAGATFGSMAVGTDGTLSSFGHSQFGLLGRPYTAAPDPTPTAVMSDVASVSAGRLHTLVVKRDGTLWAFGDNSVGELGSTTNNNSSADNATPALVMTDVAQAAAGDSFSVVLKRDGTVWTFGLNGNGQLGRSENLGAPTTATPTPVQMLSGVVQIAAGAYHAVARKADGTVWTWGWNLYGQLGVPVGTPGVAPRQVFSGAVGIGAGSFQSFAIRTDGSLWSWGLNGWFALGYAASAGSFDAQPVPLRVMDHVRDVAGGYRHTLVLSDDGSVWAFGMNTYGQLGVSGPSYSAIPLRVISSTATAGAQPYVGVTPARLLDTRADGATVDGESAAGGVRSAGTTTSVRVAGRGGVPVDARVVTLNVTVTEPQSGGFVTVWPCDQPQPLASSINFAAGATVANAIITALSADGLACIYTHAGTHLVADVDGFHPSSSPYTGLVPARLLDTRPGAETIDGRDAAGGLRGAGAVTTLAVTGRAGVPAGASAVALNVTAVEPTSGGFVTVWPCDELRPVASNVNYPAAAVVANLVVGKLADDGTVCLYTHTPTHLVVDVAGYYPAGPTYTPLTPARLLDTRADGSTVDGRLVGSGRTESDGVLVVPVEGRGGAFGARAVTLNVTATESTADGFVTVWPCGEDRPATSSLNYRAGATVANVAITKVGSDGTVCLFTHASTHLVVDLSGMVAASI